MRAVAVPAGLPHLPQHSGMLTALPLMLASHPVVHCRPPRSSPTAVSAQVDAKLAEMGATSEAGLAEAAGRLQASLEEGCHAAHLALEKRMGEAGGGCCTGLRCGRCAILRWTLLPCPAPTLLTSQPACSSQHPARHACTRPCPFRPADGGGAQGPGSG